MLCGYLGESFEGGLVALLPVGVKNLRKPLEISVDKPHQRKSSQDAPAPTVAQIIQTRLGTFCLELESIEKILPPFTWQEFLLLCAILAHGFVRVVCFCRRHEYFVGFSSKKRGF
ncbi:MAG: hypothetical protein VYA34_11195 [Myxococcota bacterium]|nr:hypothetical protein [Myxococcota bacterium]